MGGEGGRRRKGQGKDWKCGWPEAVYLLQRK